MRIDVHAHHFPTEYIECVTRMGNVGAVMSVHFAPGGKATLSERFELLDQAGIDLQVISIGPMGPYFDQVKDAETAARLGNDLYAEVCAQHPKRLACFVTVPLPHVDASLRELERARQLPGFLGVTLGCSIAGTPLDDDSFAPFFAELNRSRSILFLHPTGCACGPGSEAYGLNWSLGAPVEDAVAAMRLIVSGFTTRFPDIRIIVPHLGGMLPFLARRVESQLERQLARMGMGDLIQGSVRDHLRRFWYDTVNSLPAALRCARDELGASRLLLGTDFPYLAGDELLEAVRYVSESGLPADEVESILSSNAQKLLFAR